jgi:hypothetical protein
VFALRLATLVQCWIYNWLEVLLLPIDTCSPQHTLLFFYHGSISSFPTSLSFSSPPTSPLHFTRSDVGEGVPPNPSEGRWHRQLCQLVVAATHALRWAFASLFFSIFSQTFCHYFLSHNFYFRKSFPPKCFMKVFIGKVFAWQNFVLIFSNNYCYENFAHIFFPYNCGNHMHVGTGCLAVSGKSTGWKPPSGRS